MPHYKDGTPAQVGDFVVGKPYNTDHVIAGTLISISPGVDSCNCMVQFAQAVPRASFDAACDARYVGTGPLRMARIGGSTERHTELPVHRFVRSEQHGSAGEEFALVECVDYGAVADFELVARPPARS